MRIYTHTYSSQYRDAGRVKEIKKKIEQWLPRVKETFPRAVEGTRTIGALAQF